MNKEAKQNSRGGFFENSRKELAWTVGLSALILALFEIFFAYDPNMPSWGLDGRLPLLALGAFALWLVLVWLIGDSLFREYRWIASPAIVLVVFLLCVSWAQAKLAEETLVQYIIAPFDADGGSKVSVRHPKNIPVENAPGLEISIWSDKDWSGCASPIVIEISSAGGALLFAAPSASDKPAAWKDSARVVLKKDAPEATLMTRPAKTPGEETLVSALSVKVNGAEQKAGETIAIESARAAQVRGWKSNFLASASLIFSLAGAAIAWFKQKEEEERKEKKERIKQFVESFEEKAKIDLPGALELWESFPLASEWEPDLRKSLKTKLESFCKKDLWQVLSAFGAEEIEIIVKRFVTLSENIFERAKDSEPVQVLKQIQEAARFGDLEQILLQHHQWAAILNILAKSRYNKVVTLNPDRIPREEQIRFWASTASAASPLDAWLKERGLAFSPFLDANTPFTLMPGRREMLIGLYSSFDFSKDESLYRQPSLIFKNQWDVEAGAFAYLRAFARPTHSRQPFAVLALSKPAFAGEKPLDFALQALAESWIFEIIEDEAVFYALSESQRSLIGKLALRRHGSPASAAAMMESAFDSKMSALGNKEKNRQEEKERAAKAKEKEKNLHMLVQNVSKWLMSLKSGALNHGEIQTLLRLRPPSTNSTLFLNATDRLDVVPNELKQAPDWKFVNFRVSGASPMLAREENLVQMCRDRVKICSQERVNALEELFIPHDGSAADEILAQKAQGSPGEMVRLGQSLLLKHAESHPEKEFLEIDELNRLA